MTEHPTPSPRPRPAPAPPRTRRAALPLPTLAAFGVLAVLLWLNAAVNHYRFNVVLALLASVPVAVLVVRGALTARPGRPTR